MTQTSLIAWGTNGTGDGSLSGWTQTNWQLLFRMLFCGVNTTNLGGVADFLNKLQVSGTSSPVAVATGAAIVYGIPYSSDASENIAVPTPSGSTRIDRIVLRADWATQEVRITRIAGIEGGSAPAMTQVAGTTWDIPLATVSITTGGVITVTDAREYLTVVGAGDIITAMLADDAITGAKIADYAIDPRVHISGTNGIVIDPQNGNARGNDAVDLQTTRGVVSQVASGQDSVVAGGASNKASGSRSAVLGGASNEATGSHSSVPGGGSNLASKDYAVAFGFNAKADKYGQMTLAARAFSAQGAGQTSVLVPANVTTNATPTELYLGGDGGINERVTIATDTTWAFSILLVARRTDADNESAAYKFEGCIDNNAGTTALVGTVTKTVLAEDTAAWDADVTANNTNDALTITVTGEAAKTIRWVARVELVEVTG